ncbi:hypothetical protein mRhiFer1_008054 [Rhinolophus ferrumequinum]|uniref:peptidylprolyl isomerase n=1 Tax=Rhinolophus ferrumequinum TaxID=59479 RepID=A0A7J7WRF7_RHIFE|nr:hypothetical protein mRhiFer1_008054 [Rhinolophus ferrumequinum]
MTLHPSLLPLCLLPLLLLLSGVVCQAETGFETESPVRTLQVETLVEPPEPCAEPAAFGDTLHIHYTGSLVDGRIIDTSLTRDPLVIELGQKQVIPGSFLLSGVFLLKVWSRAFLTCVWERSAGQSFLLTWPMENGGFHRLSQRMQCCSSTWS